MGKKMDDKLVAERQSDGKEIRYISSKYDIPFEVVLKVMTDEGKNGKLARSRAIIYTALRKLGYTIKTKRYQ